MKLLRIFFHVPPLLLWPAYPLELDGLPNSHCGGVVGGVIGSPKGLCDDAEVSSVSPMSMGEMTIASDSFDDHGEITAVPDDRDGTIDILEEFDACLVECERVRANCENVDGAEALLPTAGADDGMLEDIDGDDRRSFLVDRRYNDLSSFDRT